MRLSGHHRLSAISPAGPRPRTDAEGGGAPEPTPNPYTEAGGGTGPGWTRPQRPAPPQNGEERRAGNEGSERPKARRGADRPPWTAGRRGGAGRHGRRGGAGRTRSTETTRRAPPQAETGEAMDGRTQLLATSACPYRPNTAAQTSSDSARSADLSGRHSSPLSPNGALSIAAPQKRQNLQFRPAVRCKPDGSCRLESEAAGRSARLPGRYGSALESSRSRVRSLRRADA